MNRLLYACSALLFSAVLTGCSTVAPTYPSSLDNIAALKATGPAKIKVGTFTDTPGAGNVNPISLRGTRVSSPYQESYANYVGEALKLELTLADKYAANANIDISGALIKNDVDASGFSTGRGNMDVQVVVRNNAAVRFDKVKTINHEWESSFVGGIAIPRAIAEYSTMVRKLLATLYADPEFAAALK